jgi:hypothetical protein
MDTLCTDALANPLVELHIENGVLVLTPREMAASRRRAHVAICRSKIRFTRKALARPRAREAHRPQGPPTESETLRMPGLQRLARHKK